MYTKSNVDSLFNNLEFLWNGFQIRCNFFLTAILGSYLNGMPHRLQTLPPPSPIASTKQYNQPIFNVFNLFKKKKKAQNETSR